MAARMTKGWVTATQWPGAALRIDNQCATRTHTSSMDSPPWSALRGSSSHWARACGSSRCTCFNAIPCQRPRSTSPSSGSIWTLSLSHAAVCRVRRSGAHRTGREVRRSPSWSGSTSSVSWPKWPVRCAFVQAWHNKVRCTVCKVGSASAGGRTVCHGPGRQVIRRQKKHLTTDNIAVGCLGQSGRPSTLVFFHARPFMPVHLPLPDTLERRRSSALRLQPLPPTLPTALNKAERTAR